MDQIKIDALDALSLVGLALLTLAMWIWGGWVLLAGFWGALLLLGGVVGALRKGRV